MCEFEEKVKKSFDDILILSECRKMDLRVGLAVSGGADSIALLLAMSEFVSPLYVITVNHNIRPAEESGGDVDFVVVSHGFMGLRIFL
jgi:tRNA(Ile)-lysidine synthase